MIARCRLFSHTCVVPSSSTLSSHCSFSFFLSLPPSFSVSRDPRPHGGNVESLKSTFSLSVIPRTRLVFFSFFNIYIYYVQKGSMFRIPSTRSFFSVPFCSPKDGSARQFFHRSAGNGIRSERKSKKVIRRRKKRDLWGEQRGISRAKRSFPRLDIVREKTFFRLATLFRTINGSHFVYLRLRCTTNIFIQSFPILIRKVSRE